MATYFHGGSEFQSPEGLQTLVLMNPTYVQYSDTPPPSNNLLLLNSTPAGNLPPPPRHISHAPPSTQQFVGIPLDPNSPDTSTLHGFLPRIHYNLYSSVDHNSAARETPRAQQGLSLSLSSQQQPGYGSQAQAVSGEDVRAPGGSVSSGSGGAPGGPGVQGMLLSSKYLKAAQELLDEVVTLNNDGVKSELSKKCHNNNNSNKAAGELSGGEGSAGGGSAGDANGKSGAELPTAEKQEIQMKKAKLINMLDEVEQRYRQYEHQIQIVISTFEHVAGFGSAKTYTSLALQTISKQFRCLKDAITGQVKAANKSLGEEDRVGGTKLEGSRLKFVDHHLRQQRALQQLGMIQHNAWRPQRGLPERSVSVLRAWLFEHFLHPYPKDSDKHMLAKQTGLTRSQVSNWFINARVRLWKPMVEEMYMEEIKEQERNESEDKTSKSEQNENSASNSVLQEKGSANENQTKSFKSLDYSPNHNVPSAIPISASSTSLVGENVRNHSGFSLIGSSELEEITHGSPKRQRSTKMIQSPTSVPSINIDIKPGETNNEQLLDERQSTRDEYSFIGGQNNFIGGFGQYPIADLGRFDTEQFTPRFSGNNVSLTLGLPHCENLSLSGTHHTFLPNQNIQLGRRVELAEPNEFRGINTSTTPHSSTSYETINIQNRKRFAAQLLPDFVA